MDNIVLYSKLSALPEHLKSEVADFIEYLAAKTKADKTNKGGSNPKPKFGSGKGMFKMKPDFDAPLDDFKEYMYS